MMQDVEIYTGSNSLQRTDTNAILREFLPRLQWRTQDTVLDIGCGPGDVTASILLPQLSESVTMCGIDLSDSMIKHATEQHANSRLQFKVVDFGSEDITQSLPTEHFTKVFSFYCLHWIHDQRQVIRNLRQVLSPRGEAVLLWMCRITGMTVFKMLSEIDDWKPYMKDIDRYISPFYDSTSPSEEMTVILRAEGLVPEVCEDRVFSHVYDSLDVLIDSFMAVNPFVAGIPQDLRDGYRTDMKRLVLDHDLCQTLDDSKVKIEYRIMVVHCRKPPIVIVS